MASRRAIWILGAFVGIGAAHALVGRGTHALHVVHVVFGALYLVPIVAAAIWLGARAAIALALVSAAAYVFYAGVGWAGEPMENVNQLAMAGVYLFVGAVSATLVRAAERPRRGRVRCVCRAQALQARDGATRGDRPNASARREAGSRVPRGARDARGTRRNGE